MVAGEEFEARGVWEPNRDFGPQFKADELKLRRPDSLDGTMPGDQGFDPFGISGWANMKFCREAELRSL